MLDAIKRLFSRPLDTVEAIDAEIQHVGERTATLQKRRLQLEQAAREEFFENDNPPASAEYALVCAKIDAAPSILAELQLARRELRKNQLMAEFETLVAQAPDVYERVNEWKQRYAYIQAASEVYRAQRHEVENAILADFRSRINAVITQMTAAAPPDEVDALSRRVSELATQYERSADSLDTLAREIRAQLQAEYATGAAPVLNIPHPEARAMYFGVSPTTGWPIFVKPGKD